ncbi:hypothetical protein [Halarcobacter sp.]|uniref:hypothetical protein n=1 Tax=Halarcobacter sp. TaxID=2321133 RepID=UPI0029F5A0E7|nr:hypothetical protein [Halarcobacter sp.]
MNESFSKNKKMTKKLNLLINKLQYPKEFYSSLIEIRNDNELITLCNQLKEKLDIDYFEIAVSAINEGQDIFLLTHILEKIAHLSILNTSSILSLYELLYNQMQGDLAGGSQYNITKIICDNNKDFTKSFLDLLYLIDKEYITFHISTTIISLHNTHNINQYNNVKNFLTNTENTIKTKSAIDAIDKININEQESEEVYLLFENILKIKSLDFNYLIIYASNNLKNSYSTFKNILVRSSKFKNDNTRYHISQILMFNKNEYINEDWYKECLYSLKSTNSKELGTIQNIAFTLNHILEETNSIELIQQFFILWLDNSDISSNFPDEKLDFFINEITQKYPTLLNKFVTNILNSENINQHLILHHFISSQVELDKDILDTLLHEDLLFICRKILGYLYQFEEQKSLVLSILNKEDTNKDTINLINEVFINYIGDDYPYETLKYFKSITSTKLDKNMRSITSTVIKHLEAINDSRKKLKKLKELQPSTIESREIHKANNDSMKKAMEKAQEKSIFSQLATKILIKYGKGSFSNHDNNYTKPTQMHRISTSMSIPTSERAHPIHKSIEKYHFRIAKKESK